MLPFLAPSWRAVLLAGACLSHSFGSAAYAQSGAHVAIVINEDSPDSVRIGEHYARTRSLPTENVLRIKVPASETIERGAYLSGIEGPIATAIRRGGLHDRLLYLVLTKGVPLRIAGTAGVDGTLASVDSELTLLYRKMTGAPVATAGKLENPYFLGARHPREARPFSHREHDIYLVTRLDAFTIEEALALVDKAQTPSQEGAIVLQQREGDATSAGNQWMALAAKRLEEIGHGDRVKPSGPSASAKATADKQHLKTSGAQDLKTSGPQDLKTSGPPVLGFYAWGASDPTRRQRTTGLDFVKGAIAATLASADARTFTAPPDNWTPSGSADTTTFFAGSGETLAGDLIREGATGVSGHVAEPYLGGAVRPEILFPAYLAGFNLAEAFYLATPSLSWTTVIVGDPLLRPFKASEMTSADLDPPIDARTDLPGFFAERRVAQAAASSPGIPEAAVAHAVRADSLLLRGDRPGARQALEQALAAAPTAPGLLLSLAQLEEGDKLHDAAIERYRRLIGLQPANVIALNNLAYALAVYRNAPAEGLPFARRAAAIATNTGSVLDTLGWIEHLLGNHATAARILAEAIKLEANVAEIRLHAAIVAAAMGDLAKAESELKEAVRLDPALDQRDDTRALRARIATKPPG